MPVMSDEEDAAVKAAYSGEHEKLVEHLNAASLTSRVFRQEVAKYITHLNSIIRPTSLVEGRDRRMT